MQWFHPPQLRIGDGIEEESRHATWLELFYDLVFVVAVSQLSHALSDDVSLAGFLGFTLLFIPIWWSWVGATFYANRFDVDDIGERLLTAAQMLGIAAMAVNIHHGLGESSAGFALAYAAGRVVLVFKYVRIARHLPPARGLATRYAQGFTIAALLWLLSAFVPPPYRFTLWMLAIVIDFATPLTALQFQATLLPHAEHLPERFGLFTIIVLGEAIIAVVNGVAEESWYPLSVITAVLGFSIAFALWWIYFENVGSLALRAAGRQGLFWVYQVWLFGHLPLVIGIASAGVGVEHVILNGSAAALPDGDRWLLCGSVALCLVALSILHRTGVIFRCKVRARYRLASAGILFLVALVGKGLLPIAVVSIVAIVAMGQVMQDIYQGHPVPNSASSEEVPN